MDGATDMGQIGVSKEVAIQPHPATDFRDGNIVQLALERHIARNRMSAKIAFAHMGVKLTGNIVSFDITPRGVHIGRSG